MKVVVVFGGASLEAEVSRASGDAVAAALVEAGHQATLLPLDAGLCEVLRNEAPDVVFPVAHGALGEDGCLQGLLEILALPYVGSGVLASATASDKVATKVVYRAASLPVAADLVVQPGEEPSLEDIRTSLGPEVVVKPANGGSSFGVSRLSGEVTREELRVALASATAYGPALVEALVRGTELTCGVVELDGEASALPPTEIEAQAGQFYDYRSKYSQGGSIHRCPAQLPEERLAEIRKLALRAHRALGARDLSRTDFIIDAAGALTLLETNTLPGMTSVSLFPEAAQAAGISFPRLVDGLVVAALRRAERAPQRASGVALPAPFASGSSGH